MNLDYWAGKRVFLTGHTGFKGAWLTLMLIEAGAKVYGYSLPLSSNNQLFNRLKLKEMITHFEGDIRNTAILRQRIEEARPEVIIHLAAQAIVGAGYTDPMETFGVNVLGTVSVLLAAKDTVGLRAFVSVTTDKVYENLDQRKSFLETDRLGSSDPYSTSKACAELVTACIYQSFGFSSRGAAVATARAGNVIGGGDYALGRLIPDLIRASRSGLPLAIRNSQAVRPWQHVLEPLVGYLLLAQNLAESRLGQYKTFNFGPGPESISVENVLGIVRRVSPSLEFHTEYIAAPFHEMGFLAIDSSLAYDQLRWVPKWSAARAIQETISWYLAEESGVNDMYAFTANQLQGYLND